MANFESIKGNRDMIDNEITHETLYNIIIETINNICCKKIADKNSIFEYINKELHNPNITSSLIDTRLSTLTIDGKPEIKYPLGKVSYWVKGNKVLESCKSKTPTSSPSLLSPLNYETQIVESNKDTVRDTCCSLEEKVNLLNIEIIAMKLFIEEQILIIRQSKKYSNLQKYHATATLKLPD